MQTLRWIFLLMGIFLSPTSIFSAEVEVSYGPIFASLARESQVSEFQPIKNLTTIDLPEVSEIIAYHVEHLIKQNESNGPLYLETIEQQNKYHCFHTAIVPPAELTILKYLKRIVKYGRVSNSEFMVAINTLDRFLNLNPELEISRKNIFYLLAASFIIAQKAASDQTFTLKYWGDIVGASPWQVLGVVELTMLKDLGFSVDCSVETCTQYARALGYTSLSADI